MRLVIPLEKGRKGLPIGTKRKYGKYWFVKTAQGWQYDGQGEKPGQKKFTRKPVVKGSPEQKQRLKGSPEFLNWFGDSQVVKSNGDPSENYNLEPIKVYHGTARGGFTEFKIRNESGGIYGDGVYFTEDEEVATDYSSTKEAGEKADMAYAQGYKTVDVEATQRDRSSHTAKWKELAYLPDADIMSILHDIDQSNNPNWSRQIKEAWNEAREGDKINIQKLLSGYEAKMLRDGKESTLTHGRMFLSEAIQNKWPLIYPSVPDPQVYEVYLKIENPMDMNRVVTEQEVSSLIQGLSENGFGPYIDDVLDYDTWNAVTGIDQSSPVSDYSYDVLLKIKQEMFDMVHTYDRPDTQWTRGWSKGDPVFPSMRQADREELTYGDIQYILTNAHNGHDAETYRSALEQMGYDGITHTGGWNVGTKEHKVWIAFKSTQIKSTANEGTFDPDNPDIMKAGYDLVLLLEKGRKGLPDGTRRKYGNNWFVKKNGEWLYDGRVNQKRKGSGVGKKSQKRQPKQPDPPSEPTWDDVTKLPPKELFEQKAVRSVQRDGSPGFKDLPKELVSKLKNDFGIDNLFELMRRGAEAGVYDSVHKFTNPGYMGTIHGQPEVKEKLSKLNRMMKTAVRLKADYPDNISVYTISGRRDGVEIAFAAGDFPAFNDVIGRLVVPFDKVEAAIKAHAPQYSKKWIASMKRTQAYKDWQAKGGDPKIAAAIQAFKKEVGLEIETSAQVKGRQMTLKASYIHQLTKVFQELNKHLDMRNYTPPDGRNLTVRVAASGKGFAGFYVEKDKTINISPSYPGAITHEIGHYFWYRHPELQKEFMNWVERSGLKAKLDGVLFDKVSDTEFARHIDQTFNHGMKRLFKRMGDASVYAPIMTSNAAKDGLHDWTTYVRLRLKNEKKKLKAKDWEGSLRDLVRASDADIEDAAKGIFSDIPGLQSELGRTPAQFKVSLFALRDALKQMDRTDIKNGLEIPILNMIRNSLQPGRAMAGAHADMYRNRKAGYWNEPTEIFARTFRNLVAMKAGRPIHDSHQVGGDAHKDPYGWGFKPVDADENMLRFNDNELEKMITKHIGQQVVKSIIRLAFLLEKSWDDEDDEDDEEQSERDKEFERERKNEEAKDARKSMKTKLVLHKGKPYPEGTIRTHGGQKVKKVQGGWVPVSGDRKSGKDDPSSKNAKKPKPVPGSPGLLEAVQKVADGERVFLDDLRGDEARAMNTLTKEGMIKWEPFAEGEYVATLTEAGEKAARTGIAKKRKADREEEQSREAVVDAVFGWVYGHGGLMPTRSAVRLQDGTLSEKEMKPDHAKKAKDKQKNAEALLSNVKKLDDKTLWRSTRTKEYAKLKPGDEIPLGLGSFTRSDTYALAFNGQDAVMIRHVGDAYGVDIQEELGKDDVRTKFREELKKDPKKSDPRRNTPKMDALDVEIEAYRMEEEIALRATHLRVVNVTEEEFELDPELGFVWTMPVVEVESVLPEDMQKAEKKEDRKAFLEKLSKEFDKRMPQKKAKHKTKKE